MRLIIALTTIAFSCSTLAGIYKWTDANGKVHFSDRPMSKNAEALELTPTNSVSFTKTSANHGSNLTIYTAEWCGYCTKAKKYMRDNKIVFREFDIEKSREGKLRYQSFNSKSIPLFTLNQERMTGFSPKRLDSFIKRNQ